MVSSLQRMFYQWTGYKLFDPDWPPAHCVIRETERHIVKMDYRYMVKMKYSDDECFTLPPDPNRQLYVR